MLELDICDLIDIKYALKYDIQRFRDCDMNDSADNLEPVFNKICAMIEADRNSWAGTVIKLTTRGE